MKYVTPKYELSVIEAEDILMSAQKYEITESADENGNKTGNVIMSAINVFN